MNRLIIVLAVMAAMVSVPAQAEVYTNITSYVASYEYVPGTNVDIGGTGLSTGTAYICFSRADISYLSAADADETTGNFKVLAYALARYLYDSFAAVASSNRSSKVTITETKKYDNSQSSFRRDYRTTTYTDIGAETVAAD